jgi:hypothetical protein
MARVLKASTAVTSKCRRIAEAEVIHSPSMMGRFEGIAMIVMTTPSMILCVKTLRLVMVSCWDRMAKQARFPTRTLP